MKPRTETKCLIKEVAFLATSGIMDFVNSFCINWYAQNLSPDFTGGRRCEQWR